jgi:hypothetical protein
MCIHRSNDLHNELDQLQNARDAKNPQDLDDPNDSVVCIYRGYSPVSVCCTVLRDRRCDLRPVQEKQRNTTGILPHHVKLKIQKRPRDAGEGIEPKARYRGKSLEKDGSPVVHVLQILGKYPHAKLQCHINLQRSAQTISTCASHIRCLSF